jgi:hypothetical protein
MKDKNMIRNGIAVYEREQRVLVRLLRKRGTFTEDEFDKWFCGREWRKPMVFGPKLTGDTFCLGMGINGGNQWAVMLDLLHMMIELGIVSTRTECGKVMYSILWKNGVMK